MAPYMYVCISYYFSTHLKIHLTFHQHVGEEIMTELNIFW